MATTSTTSGSWRETRDVETATGTLPVWLRALVRTENDPGALIARVVLGAVMLPHGAQKLLGWFGGYGFSGTMDFFTQSLGIPALLAFLVIVAESFGALALITGLLGRVAAFGVGAVMVGAVLMSHLRNGFFMNWYGNQAGEGFEYHLLALGLALVVLVRGSGALSVDRVLSRGDDGRTTS
jgi:putative oxidoreductase